MEGLPKEALEQVAAYFQALSEPTRLTLLNLLRGGERSDIPLFIEWLNDFRTARTLAIFSHGKDQVVDLIGSGPGEVVEFDGTDAPGDTASKRKRLEDSRYLTVQLTYRDRGADL